MATRNSSRRGRSRARIGGNRPRTHPSGRPTGDRMPQAAAAAIERERLRLQKASALLACLAFAANHDANIDAGSIAAVVSDLIDLTLERLDSVTLSQAAAPQQPMAIPADVPDTGSARAPR